MKEERKRGSAGREDADLSKLSYFLTRFTCRNAGATRPQGLDA